MQHPFYGEGCFEFQIDTPGSISLKRARASGVGKVNNGTPGGVLPQILSYSPAVRATALALVFPVTTFPARRAAFRRSRSSTVE